MSVATPARASDCTKAANSVEQVICDTPALNIADARLADFYDATLQTLTGPRHGLLQATQSQWLADRETQCIDDLAACLGTMIDAQADAISVCFAGQPGTTTSCPYTLQTSCPILMGYGSPALAAYPFLLDGLARELKDASAEFDCVNDPDLGEVAADNKQTQTLTVITERPGLVCLDNAIEGYRSGAAHPFHRERLQCYDTKSELLLPFDTVFPTATAGSDLLADINAAVDGHLTLTCCGDDETGDASFQPDIIDTPIGWAIDAAGNPQIGYEYSAYGRGFLAYGPVPREQFLEAIAPAFRHYFSAVN